MDGHYQAIAGLMNDYCRLIDDGDLEGFAKLFARGSWGVVGEPGGPAHGAGQVLQRLGYVTLYDGLPLTSHTMSNVQINVASDRAATASCTITVMQAVPPDLPLQTIFIGRYTDRFARDDSGWHFLSRDIEPRLVGDMRFHRADMA